MFAILFCQGGFAEKSIAFWDILQDGDQTFLSANDKDYKPAFMTLCEISTVFEFEVSRDYANVKCEYTEDEFATMRESFEDVQEKHLDELFDCLSKLEKDQWLNDVGEKTPYVFAPGLLRAKVLGFAGLDKKY